MWGASLGLERFLFSFGKNRTRVGTAEDRGRVLRFPHATPQQAVGAYRRIVPGIIAGAADLDPAAALTATVAGAGFGLSVAWVVLLCFPIVQSVLGVSARIGHETRLGLVSLIRMQFGKTAAYSIAGMVVAVNILMIVADLMAVSDALSILVQQAATYFPALVAFTVWYILNRVGYDKVTTTLSAIALFLLAYVVAAALGTSSVIAVAKGIFAPKFSGQPGYIMAVIAVFGSLLTPDVIVWQTSTKREIGATFHNEESRYGCAVAVFISLSAIIAASHMHVADPSSMTARQAAEALAPIGVLGPPLFALGIIGSGLVALPILVSSLCFSIAEAAGWKYGLSKEPWEARGFFVLICFILVFAVVVNYIGINTVRTLYWSQVLAGLFIVPILFFILWLSNDRRIMHTVNTKWDNFWLGGAVGGMIVANLVFLWSAVF